jgi:hypothetical protein
MLHSKWLVGFAVALVFNVILCVAACAAGTCESVQAPPCHHHHQERSCPHPNAAGVVAAGWHFVPPIVAEEAIASPQAIDFAVQPQITAPEAPSPPALASLSSVILRI